MHSPPSPKVNLDTVTLSAAAAVGAASVLKDSANILSTARSSVAPGGHHSASKKPSVVDMHLISQQIHELSHRVDNLESSMKSDIRTILEILQQQQPRHHPPVQCSASGRPIPKIHQQQPPTIPERQITSTYQTDSDHPLFDLGLGGQAPQYQSSTASYGGANAASGNGMKLTPTQQKQQHRGGGNVQRSISQPECANNDRNLFTWVEINLFILPFPIHLAVVSQRF